MGLTECPHCNGSLDVEPCDRCSELYSPGELQWRDDPPHPTGS